MAYFLLFWTSHCVLTPGGEPVGRNSIQDAFLSEDETANVTANVTDTKSGSTPSVDNNKSLLLLLLGVALFDARRCGACV